MTNQKEIDEFIKDIGLIGGYYKNFVKNRDLAEKYRKFTKEELIDYINEKPYEY